MAGGYFLEAAVGQPPEAVRDALLADQRLGLRDAGRWKDIWQLATEETQLAIQRVPEGWTFGSHLAETAIAPDLLIGFDQATSARQVDHLRRVAAITGWLIEAVPGRYALLGEAGGPETAMLAHRDDETVLFNRAEMWDFADGTSAADDLGVPYRLGTITA